MKIEFVTIWDQAFFERFINLKNELFKNDQNIFNDSIEDMKKFFSSGSPITKDHQWKAYIVSKNGEDLSRGVLSHKNGKLIGQIGFLEFAENFEAFQLMLQTMNTDAKALGLTQLRGPANINFFVSYRWKLPHGGEPFYTEPVVPDYYHQFIQKMGFVVSETWDTFKLDFWKTIKNWGKKRKVIQTKKKTNYQKLEIRSIRPWDFDREIEIIHKLFVASYKEMSEYDEIDLESFKLLYSDFKYLINPLFSYIATVNGEPIGFVINIFDSFLLLRQFSKRSPTLLEKARLLTQIQLNNKRLLIMYSGRIPTSSGEEVKGLQIRVSKRLCALFVLFRIKEILVCFQSENSPSKRSFDDEAQTSYSKYVMYRKDI